MTADKSHKAFFSNTAWQYGLQVIKYIFPLIVLPYLARILEPEGFAIYAYVVSIMTIVRVLVDFGFNLSGTRQIIKAKRKEGENEVIGAITQTRIAIGVAATILVFIVVLASPITQGYVLYALLAHIGMCMVSFAPDFVFQGHEKMRTLTTRFLVSKGVSTVLTFILVRSAGDILWIPILDIVAGVIALTWSFIAAKKMFGVSFKVVSLKRCIKELKTSALYCFSNVSSALLTGFATVFIGFAISDAAQVSYWSLAVSAIGAVTSFYMPISNSLYPHMINTRDFRFVKKMALMAFPFLTLGTVVFALLAELIVLLLGGQEYLPGVSVLVMISPVAFFSFFAILFGWPVLGAIGRVRELTRTTVFAAFFCIISLLVAALFGVVSIELICFVRVAAEVILCGARLLECRHAMRSGDLVMT